MHALVHWALLAMVVVAMAGAAARVMPAAEQYCWKCMGCSEMFRIVPGAVPPASCPSCGFRKVIANTATMIVYDWATRVRCGESPQPQGDPARAMRGTSNMNVRQATTKLDSIAEKQPRGLCALYVLRALKAGGISVEGHPVNAAKYGGFLLAKGFVAIGDPENYRPRKGDVVVIQPRPGTSGPGHIAMFTGEQWVSDYRQAKFWGTGRRPPPGTYTFYRP